MKAIALIIGFVISSVLSFAQAELFFDSPTHKFDKVEEGPKLQHVYYFTNRGDAPLLITDYKVSCSCTKAKFPLHPVLPNQNDSIIVTFDTKGKIGYQDRTIDIFSSAKNNPEKIRFKVFVKPKKD